MVTSTAPRPSRAPRGLVALALAVVLALIGWAVSQHRRNHWREVAEARRYLDRGQFDRALRAVAGIADERPGAPEGLTLAGRALLALGKVAPARRVLEQ